jgi:hypothetical protein
MLKIPLRAFTRNIMLYKAISWWDIKRLLKRAKNPGTIAMMVLYVPFITVLMPARASAQQDADFATALENGIRANEGFTRCIRFVKGWLNHADPATGLIPRNLQGSNFWNAKDAAADNYPFMVLSTAITDRSMFDGVMLDMLNKEKEVTPCVDRLPCTFDFGTQQQLNENLSTVIFGASEYVKDGLMPLTEWLGESPWSTRMLELVDDIWKNAAITTPYGNIPATDHEVCGEMLQAQARIYWMTGEEKYLDWAIRLGDYFLLGNNHPTDDGTSLRLRDHGNEIIAGLAELYAVVHVARPDKKAAYQGPLYRMLDRILEIGRNDDGFLYNSINPQTGDHDANLADNWGYVLNAHYTVYLIDGVQAYRNAVLKALNSLSDPYYINTHRFGENSDGHADAIESALNLYHRELTHVSVPYLDVSTTRMWGMQQADGVIEGWHGDGNFARTTVMYCTWKTQGITIQPWDSAVTFGAVYNHLRTGDNSLLPDFTVNSSRTYTIVPGGAEQDSVCHTDRDYTLSVLPASLQGKHIILTPVDDRAVTAAELISFTAPSDLTLYVGFDVRTTSLPDWMSGWTNAGATVNTSEPTLSFNMFSKTFTGGNNVILGGPRAAGYQSSGNPGNYIVIIDGTLPEIDTSTVQVSDNILKVAVTSTKDWNGSLIFDVPRHRVNMGMPFDWTRINQFPEWYTVEAESSYIVENLTVGSSRQFTGAQLVAGLPLTLSAGIEQHITVRLASVADIDREKLSDDPNGPAIQIHFAGESIIFSLPVQGKSVREFSIYQPDGVKVESSIAVKDNRLIWNASHRENGIYVCKAVTDRDIIIRKFILNR